MHINKKEAALELAEAGFSIVPISPASKRPLEKWKGLQEEAADEEVIGRWWSDYPDADVGVVTGQVSGIVVIDCDSDEAIELVNAQGIDSPVRVRTKRGLHLYFAHNGSRVRNAVNWRGMSGVDVRGDGGYVKVPPSTNYSWDNKYPIDINDLVHEMPRWSYEDTREELTQLPDLSGVKPLEIPSEASDGSRNSTMTRIVGKLITDNPKLWGKELLIETWAENQRRCTPPLDGEEIRTIVRSVAEIHKRNHPDEFNADGERAMSLMTEQETMVSSLLRTIYGADASMMFGDVAERKWLVERMIPAGLPGVLASGGGVGKTYLLLDLAIKVAYFNEADRATFMGHPVRKYGKVVMFLAEDDRDEVMRRLRAIDPFGTRGLEQERLMVVSMLDMDEPIQFGAKNYDVPVLTAQAKGIEEALMEIDDLALVVFDPLQSFFDWRFDEDNLAADKALKFAHRIASKTGASVVFTHHLRKEDLGNAPTTPQGAISKIRGASNIVNSSRFAIPIWRPSEDVSARIAEEIGCDENNGIFMAGLGKENFGGDTSTHWLVRDSLTGLLVDRTLDVTKKPVEAPSSQRVETILRESSIPLSVNSISEGLSIATDLVRVAIKTLYDKGVIIRPTRGVYLHTRQHEDYTKVRDWFLEVSSKMLSTETPKRLEKFSWLFNEGVIPFSAIRMVVNDSGKDSPRAQLWREVVREFCESGDMVVQNIEGKAGKNVRVVRLLNPVQVPSTYYAGYGV